LVSLHNVHTDDPFPAKVRIGQFAHAVTLSLSVSA
jgi:hypothetical protein